MEFNSIGFFQFDNLIQTRTPFLLILLDEVELTGWYNSVINMHVQNISVKCQTTEALNSVMEKNLPPHFAIVVLDKDASTSPGVVAQLEKAGFINSYYVAQGFEGLKKERGF